MKQVINTLLFCTLLLSNNAIGQVSNAKVKYAETMHFELPEHVVARGGDAPTSRDLNKILLVNGKESIYKENTEDIVAEEAGSDLDRRRRRGPGFRMGSSNSTLYQNIETGEQLEKINMFDKDFLVKEEVQKLKWKIIATEQREILGYTCMKAEYQDTSKLVTAWFSPQLPISYGPAGYSGLPGLILAMSEGENKIILATSIETNIEEVVIEKPDNKKEYTRSEFTKLRDEKIEEMKAMWGGRRNR